MSNYRGCRDAGCERVLVAKNMCQSHYQSFARATQLLVESQKWKEAHDFFIDYSRDSEEIILQKVKSQRATAEKEVLAGHMQTVWRKWQEREETQRSGCIYELESDIDDESGTCGAQPIYAKGMCRRHYMRDYMRTQRDVIDLSQAEPIASISTPAPKRPGRPRKEPQEPVINLAWRRMDDIESEIDNLWRAIEEFAGIQRHRDAEEWDPRRKGE